MCFYHLGEKTQHSELRPVWEPNGKWHRVPQKTLNIKWKYRLSCFPFHASLFSFISPLLHCFHAISFFEHVSGSGFLSDWNRCCAWIVVALFWCDCNSTCEYIQRLWWKWVFFPYGFSSLWLGPKGQRWYPAAHPVCLTADRATCGCGCACLSKHLLAKSRCTLWSGDDGQLTLWSSTYLGYRCSLL